MTVPTMVTLAEASRQTHLSYDFLRKLCLQNKIVYIRAGTKYLINLEKLVEFLNQGDQMASREELLNSIHSDMKLARGFFMKVYGYELTWPGFAEIAIEKLEGAGCSKAREYYQNFVDEYEGKQEEKMCDVAHWYRRRIDGWKGDDKVWKRQQEVEQKKEHLQQKSDKELLISLQKLKAEGIL